MAFNEYFPFLQDVLKDTKTSLPQISLPYLVSLIFKLH